MRVLFWNLIFATWLLVSAFLFPQTPFSIALTVVAAAAVATLAAVAAGKPGARYFIAVIALALAFLALLLPDLSGLARLNDALVAATLFALALVSPVHATPREPTTSTAHS